MMVNLKMDKSMAKVSSIGLMANSTMENGSMARCTGEGVSHILMGADMKEISRIM